MLSLWNRCSGDTSCTFFKTDDLSQLFIKRMGHLRLCAVFFFLRRFFVEGNAQLCEDLPQEDFDTPVDVYNHPLKEYWFKFSSPRVTEHEETFSNDLHTLFLTTYIYIHLEILVHGKPEMCDLKSPFGITRASVSRPFLISLNALLVITGSSHVFTKYSQDNRLLALQAVAKANKMGPL